MRLIIRDDDLSYAATPEALERLYDGIWEHVPVHFAVIPYVFTRQKETPQTLKRDYYWIGENKRLVRFLKEKMREGKVVIWQHGFSHKDYRESFELERNDEEVLYQELRKGKKHLEKTFGVVIDTLVPPHDRMSKAAVRAAERAGFTRICRGFAPLPREIRWLSPTYLSSYFKLVLFWLRHGRARRYARPLQFGGHTEEFFYRVQDIKKENLREVLRIARSGDLRVTTHYRTLDEKGRKVLKELLRRLKH